MSSAVGRIEGGASAAGTVSQMAEAIARYRPLPSVWDEFKSAAGEVRPHWGPFADELCAVGYAGMRERRESAKRLLREHGVTYNVYADGRSDERPWNLDLLPLVISPEEWARLEKGLIQRTRLLDLILKDIYGEQRILRDGLAPPGLIHANPGFLRPAHGVRPAGDRFLTFHAVDLVRAANGEWWVLADRTQSPSGVGYSLENRIILSRVLGDEFHDLPVRRVASFFQARKAGLRALASWTDSPMIALLTPGPYTATYFEHAYIARYLGYPLVEGSDLTVRDRRLFIKTIDGLHRVDVLIRRVDDTYCDPLELRSDSFLGVPGLLDAARAGNVAISNGLGSGAVEGPAWLAFLPALSRRLLNEELHIPNVATWWCGQSVERNYALGNLRSLVVKAAFSGGKEDPVFCETLGSGALEELAARIRDRPSDFVAQQRVPLSTAPVWQGDHFEPRPLILRCFVAAGADGFVVMPGGLTRLSATPDSPVVSSRFGGGSKDTWALAAEPVEEVTMFDRRGSAAPAAPTAGVVSSRMLDNLFWLGRYTERLEDTVRLFRVVLARLASEGSADEAEELAAMARCLVALDRLPARFTGQAPVRELTAAFGRLVFERSRPGSIASLLQRVNVLTARLRVRFSGDTWRILHQLQTEFPAEPSPVSAAALLEILHRLVFQLAALSGVETENMTRGTQWLFLDLGRRIERANNVVEVIRAILVSDPEARHSLVPLLEYCDSTMTYRRRYFSAPDLPSTLGLLLADHTNPRAFAFQWASVGDHLAQISVLGGTPLEMERFGGVSEALRCADFRELCAEAAAGRPESLAGLLDLLAESAWELSDALTIRYFANVAPRAN